MSCYWSNCGLFTYQVWECYCFVLRAAWLVERIYGEVGVSITPDFCDSDKKI